MSECVLMCLALQARLGYLSDTEIKLINNQLSSDKAHRRLAPLLLITSSLMLVMLWLLLLLCYSYCYQLQATASSGTAECNWWTG